MRTGSATGGTSGSISISVGSGNTNAGGRLVMSAGESSAETGGSVSLVSGFGTFTTSGTFTLRTQDSVSNGVSGSVATKRVWRAAEAQDRSLFARFGTGSAVPLALS